MKKLKEEGILVCVVVLIKWDFKKRSFIKHLVQVLKEDDAILICTTPPILLLSRIIVAVNWWITSIYVTVCWWLLTI